MEHGLELFIPILEILEIEVCNILYNPGHIGKHIFSLSPMLEIQECSGSYDPYISPILEILDCTIHICSYVDVAGGRGGSPAAATAAATAAAATSQQLSHLARPLDHHTQGPNIPFGLKPSLR